MRTGTLFLGLLAIFAFSSCNGSAFSSGGGKASNASPDREEKKSKKVPIERNDGDSESRSEDATGVDTKDGSKAEPKDEDEERRKALPKFAMMANHFECGFCHVQVIGSMVSTQTVPPSRADSVGEVIGDWLVRGTLDVAQGGAKVTVDGAVQENYDGADVPKTFPLIQIASLAKVMKGKLSAGGASSTERIEKVAKGNTVLIGTKSDPIIIDKDVLIEGDLIITGVFKGVGTIYATGSIFIPYDLKAESSPFPFDASDDGDNALDDDGLGLAAAGSIYVGDAGTGLIGAGAPVNTRASVDSMYSWFGKSKFEALYGGTYDCDDGELDREDKGVNVVDAFLYAAKSIEGKSARGSFSIRGGILTNYYNVLNADTSCPTSNEISPAHGHLMNRSYIEYDRRIQTGKYPVLEQLGEVLRREN